MQIYEPGEPVAPPEQGADPGIREDPLAYEPGEDQTVVDDGVLNLDDARVLAIPPLSQLGTPVQLVNAFGGKANFEHAVHEMQAALYDDVA